MGLKVGDVVTYSVDDEYAGGVVYVIVEATDPIAETNGWSRTMRDTCHVRLKPVFKFFPTPRGDEPRGKGGTILVYDNDFSRIRKVTLTDLGAKYAELTTFIQELVKRDGSWF